MRVVIDTNVVVSAALKDRDPEAVLVHVVERPEFEWIATQEGTPGRSGKAVHTVRSDLIACAFSVPAMAWCRVFRVWRDRITIAA